MRLPDPDAPRGESISDAEASAWFEEERNAYNAQRPAGPYAYGALNHSHGFRFLPGHRFAKALAFGAVDLQELAPVLSDLQAGVLLDAAPPRPVNAGADCECFHLQARADGRITLPDGAVDLITCFGTLHHLPRVSSALRELWRVLRPGGWMLLREPVISMGDSTKPRPGLTPNERGLPPLWLRHTLRDCGFRIHRATPCNCVPLALLGDRLGLRIYQNRMLTALDRLVCRLMPFPGPYHRTRLWHHFTAASLFFVLEKPPQKD